MLTEAAQAARPRDDNVSPLVRYHGLKAEGIHFSRAHLAVLEAAGQFPRRIRLGKNSIAWDRAAIRAWVAERLAEARGER
jgi:predicted DNA-binding transcriptional regulator AlpA